MSITKLPPAQFAPPQKDYIPTAPFRFWCQKVLPLVYDDSLSYYELLNKVVKYLNDVIANADVEQSNIQALYEAYVKLQSWVNVYFDTLDVQQEINNKLDGLVEDGTMSILVEPFINKYGVEFVSSTDNMTRHNTIYCLTTDNNQLYRWNGTAFAPTGALFTMPNNLISGRTRVNSLNIGTTPFNDFNSLPVGGIYSYSVNIETNNVANRPNGIIAGDVMTFNYSNTDAEGQVQVMYDRYGTKIAVRTKWSGVWQDWQYYSPDGTYMPIPQMFKTSSNSWSDAIQSCLDLYNCCFLPEGTYELDKPIVVNGNNFYHSPLTPTVVGQSIIGAGYRSVLIPPKYNQTYETPPYPDTGDIPLGYARQLATVPYRYKKGDEWLTGTTDLCEDNANRYTYAIILNTSDAGSLTNFRIKSREGVDVGCGIITVPNGIGQPPTWEGLDGTRGAKPQRYMLSNLWIEYCAVGFGDHAGGLMCNNILIDGHDASYKSQKIGLVHTGTDSFYDNLIILRNYIGMYMWAGGYFNGCKTLVNCYGMVAGRSAVRSVPGVYGEEFETTYEGQTVQATMSPIGSRIMAINGSANHTAKTIRMTNSFHQQNLNINMILYNIGDCDINIGLEASGDRWKNVRGTQLTYDGFGNRLAECIIQQAQYSRLNFVGRLLQSGGYERYYLYITGSRINNCDINCMVAPSAQAIGHRFDMVGGNIHALLPSQVKINGVNWFETAEHRFAYLGNLNANTTHIFTKNATAQNYGRNGTHIQFNNPPALGDGFAFQLPANGSFGGRFKILSNDLLRYGIQLRAFRYKVTDNVIDWGEVNTQSANKAKLFDTPISDGTGSFTTQFDIAMGSKVSADDNWAVGAEIIYIPEVVESVDDMTDKSKKYRLIVPVENPETHLTYTKDIIYYWCLNGQNSYWAPMPATYPEGDPDYGYKYQFWNRISSFECNIADAFAGVVGSIDYDDIPPDPDYPDEPTNDPVTPDEPTNDPVTPEEP